MQQKQPNLFAKLSTLAIQMGIIIGLAVWGGQKLDARYSKKTPVYTIILSLVGIVAAMYIALRDFIRPKK